MLYTVHGLSCSRRAAGPVRRFYAGVERFIASRADHVVSVSEADRRFGVEHRLFPPGRTSTIPNGVEVNGRGSAAPAPFTRPGPVRAVTVGRLVPQKGIPILLEAAARVLAEQPEMEFTVFGDGPDRAALERQAARLGIDGSVRFAGTVPDVAGQLASFDLFVLPSLWEGMSIALLEAMAGARPVLATATSGSAELVIDGETGRLVPPGDAGALADGILSLLADPVAAREMAARGQDRVRRNYGLSRMVESTVELYRSLLSVHEPG